MLHIKQAVLVEGKYDKIKLASILDAVILELGGFHIFNDREKLSLIRRLAEECGVVLFTDSDRAGFQIRSFLGGALPREQVWHAYLPDIFGKEKRKNAPSAEGKVGVEGADKAVLLETLARAGVLCEENAAPARRVAKQDLYEVGLSGRKDSRVRRAALLRSLDLPERLPPNALPGVLSALMTRAEFLVYAAEQHPGKDVW
ncbi:MAG: DUF4093 domain-containing protein [Oscillospiraceae bacterium]|jgi:ribonuclease M5|nr:DUF4093 domain-containing protein [Oscillospiraceae bacterium]